MKSNPLLKWLLIPMGLLLVFVGIKLFSGERGAKPAPAGAASQLTPEEMKALGVEGDTPRDTVATLVAQVKQLRNELQTALTDNKNQKAENERMRAREGAIDQRIQTALDGERSRLQQDRDQVANDRQQTQGLLQDLQRRLDGLSGKGGQADLPVGLGLEDGDGKNFGGSQGSGARPSSGGGTRWVEPDDAKPQAKTGGTTGGLNFPTSFGPAQKALSNAADTAADVGTQVASAVRLSAKPVYTVPSNSTLMGSIAMTALIGRVPIDGTVNDPYPFKVLIGPDNLTANGIDIPQPRATGRSRACAARFAASPSYSRTARSAPCRRKATARRAAAVKPMAPMAIAPRTAAWAGSAIPTASHASPASGAATPSSTSARRR